MTPLRRRRNQETEEETDIYSSFDKKESKNLVSQKPKKTKELEKLLMNYLKEVHAPKWQEGITWKGLSISEINSNY